MIKDNQRTLNIFQVLADAALIIAALFAAYPIRFYLLPSLHLFALTEGTAYLSFAAYTENIVYLVPGYLVIYYLCGIYRPKRGHSIWRILMYLLEANVLGIFYFAFLLYIQKESDISRTFYFVFFGLNILFGFTFRFITILILNSLRKHGHNLKHVLMVGYSRAAEGYIDRINSNPEWGYKIHGILDDNLAVGTRYKRIPILNDLSALEKLISENDFDEIVIALSLDEYEKLEHVAMICEKTGVHTKFVPDYNNIVSTVPYIEDLYGLPVINIRNVPLSNFSSMLLKRIGDIVLGILALIIFAIPMCIVAIIIKATSKGPVLYKQERIGLHGKSFMMYKFRSMRVEDPEKEKSGWTTPGDARITPIGSFIRKTSIDELPQLFNVIGGSMSLVGPRPERPQFVKKFKEEIPRYMVKHQVRPGITGWAQVNGRNALDWETKFRYDVEYVDRRSLFFDLRILFRTVAAVFAADGISAEGEATMSEFTGGVDSAAVLPDERRKAAGVVP